MKNLFLLWSFVFMFIKIQGESANDRLLDGRIMGKKNQTNSATRFDDFHEYNLESAKPSPRRRHQDLQPWPLAETLQNSQMNFETVRSSEEAVTKKPRKKKLRRRTRKPKKEPCPDSDEEYDETVEEDTIVSDQPAPGSKRKPPKKPKPEDNGKVFFEETFTDRSWESAWVYSKMEYGTKEKKKYEKFYRVRSRRGNKGFDYGLVTSNKGSEDYAISANFQPFNSNDGPLVVQFAMQYQSAPHCEYVYLRLFDCKFKSDELTMDSPYLIQMGPNICSDEKYLDVVIMDPVKGEKYVISDKVPALVSTDIHMYGFVIHPDGNYQILVNDKFVQNGSLSNAFPNYQGFPSICAVGLNVWHSILDKFFLGQIIIDDVLISSDVNYAQRKRFQILDIVTDTNNSTMNKNK